MTTNHTSVAKRTRAADFASSLFQVHAATLTDREAVVPLVRADERARGIADLSRSCGRGIPPLDQRPRQLIERSDIPVRSLEGLPSVSGIIDGGGDGRCEISVGAIRFACDLLDPHKTGFYLDQQANYGAVAMWVRPGMRVLDAGCGSGHRLVALATPAAT